MGLVASHLCLVASQGLGKVLLTRFQLLTVAALVQIRLGHQLLPVHHLCLASIQSPLASLDALAILVEGPPNGFRVLDDLRLTRREGGFSSSAVRRGGRTILHSHTALCHHWGQGLFRLASRALAHLLGEANSLLAPRA